jgi:hypothetical protein
MIVGCGAELGPIADDGASLRPDAGRAQAQDASADGPAAVTENACGLALDHGALGSLGADADSALQEGSTTARVESLEAVIPRTDAQGTPDLIVIELWDGYGVFAGGAVRTGTIEITGTETDYDTCGACVLQFANVANDTPAKLLLATSGTITVTAVGTGAGQMTRVSLSNASFVEIAPDTTNGGYQTVAGSSCRSPISTVELSGTI